MSFFKYSSWVGGFRRFRKMTSGMFVPAALFIPPKVPPPFPTHTHSDLLRHITETGEWFVVESFTYGTISNFVLFMLKTTGFIMFKYWKKIQQCLSKTRLYSLIKSKPGGVRMTGFGLVKFKFKQRGHLWAWSGKITIYIRATFRIHVDLRAVFSKHVYILVLFSVNT